MITQGIERFEKLKYLLFVPVLIYLLVIYLHALINAPVTTDAGYYLSYAREIARGNVPYKDFPLAYTPFGIYCFSVVSLLTGSSIAYWPYLLFIVLLHWCNAYLIYNITSKTIGKFGSMMLAFTFLLLVYQIEGLYCTLEAFVVFFILLAIRQYLIFTDRRFSHIYTGIFCGLAFLSKQYGIGIFVLLWFLYTIDLLKGRTNIKRYSSFVAGFFAIIFLFILFFTIQGLNIKEIYSQLFRVSYGQHSVNQWVYKTYNFLISVKFIWVLIVGFLIFLWKAMIFKKEVLLAFGGILGFSLQFYFETYDHYGILILPFLIIWLFLIFKVTSTVPFKGVYSIFILIGLLIFINNNRMFFRWNVNGWNREEQYKTAAILNNYVKGKSAYFFSYPEHYFILNLSSIDLKKVGYTFSNIYSYSNSSSDKINTVISRSEVLVFSGQNSKAYLPFIKEYFLITKIDDMEVYFRIKNQNSKL
jgi:hypothetical protein